MTIGARGRGNEEDQIMTLPTDKKTDQDRKETRHPERANLDRRYGKIGIPAVAAALKYCAAGKKRSTSPVFRVKERFIEFAARRRSDG